MIHLRMEQITSPGLVSSAVSRKGDNRQAGTHVPHMLPTTHHIDSGRQFILISLHDQDAPMKPYHSSVRATEPLGPHLAAWVLVNARI
jgi:hypothetical protein